MASSMSSLIAYALTGETLSLDPETDSAASLLDALESAGWPPQRVRDQALLAWEEERPWPHPLPPSSVAEVGAAQWYARLAQARALLGLDAVQLPPSRRTVLTPEERRLLTDVPPHHGPVG
ncbi:MAG: hypothetical protein FWD75_05650 [Propionibacteriaceae bacterium]|nr:hypothetical protein [Propionibacteriaceae bacterium]